MQHNDEALFEGGFFEPNQTKDRGCRSRRASSYVHDTRDGVHIIVLEILSRTARRTPHALLQPRVLTPLTVRCDSYIFGSLMRWGFNGPACRRCGY